MVKNFGVYVNLHLSQGNVTVGSSLDFFKIITIITILTIILLLLLLLLLLLSLFVCIGNAHNIVTPNSARRRMDAFI